MLHKKEMKRWIGLTGALLALGACSQMKGNPNSGTGTSFAMIKGGDCGTAENWDLSKATDCRGMAVAGLFTNYAHDGAVNVSGKLVATQKPLSNVNPHLLVGETTGDRKTYTKAVKDAPIRPSVRL